MSCSIRKERKEEKKAKQDKKDDDVEREKRNAKLLVNMNINPDLRARIITKHTSTKENVSCGQISSAFVQQTLSSSLSPKPKSKFQCSTSADNSADVCCPAAISVDSRSKEDTNKPTVSLNDRIVTRGTNKKYPSIILTPVNTPVSAQQFMKEKNTSLIDDKEEPAAHFHLALNSIITDVVPSASHEPTKIITSRSRYPSLGQPDNSYKSDAKDRQLLPKSTYNLKSDLQPASTESDKSHLNAEDVRKASKFSMQLTSKPKTELMPYSKSNISSKVTYANDAAPTYNRFSHMTIAESPSPDFLLQFTSSSNDFIVRQKETVMDRSPTPSRTRPISAIGFNGPWLTGERSSSAVADSFHSKTKHSLQKTTSDTKHGNDVKEQKDPNVKEHQASV